jgi:hypothetical protein
MLICARRALARVKPSDFNRLIPVTAISAESAVWRKNIRVSERTEIGE